MGPFAAVVLAGCLKALGGLLWGVAGLMLLLIVVQRLRGDEGADPVSLLAMAAAFAAIGWGCIRAGRIAAR